MRKFFRLLTLATAVLAATAPAQAGTTTLDFEPGSTDTTFAPMAPLLTHGDALIQGNYAVVTVSTKTGARLGEDLVGALVNGSDVVNTCVSVSCPTNNPTNFLAMLDDGMPYITTLDRSGFQIKSFDASFIAANGVVVPSISLLLRVYGFTEDGDGFYEDVLLPGPVNGAYGFGNYVLSDSFTSRSYVEVDFYGYACNAAGSCNRSSNVAQFAIDNIVLVPEPASLALVGLAIAGLGTMRRRRPTAPALAAV